VYQGGNKVPSAKDRQSRQGKASIVAGKDYQISALWMYGSLSFLEQLCLKSFLDAGHHVKLYHYGPLQNVPDGIELADANDVLPQTNFLTHQRTGSPALHSDLFRYKMLEQSTDTIWADTDAYCMKKFQTPTGHFYGWESTKHINGGVLGLPPDSDALRELLEFTSDEFAIPTWYSDEYTRELRDAAEAGNPVHASEQPWGVWGPHAVTHFLHKTGEHKYALPQEGLYPFTYRDRRKMLKRNFDTSPYITENTYSVHLYGRRMRARLVEKEGGAPHHKSLLGQLITKHGIDPAKAPLPEPRAQAPAPAKKPAPTKPAPVAVAAAPVPAAEKIGRGQMNLTDLADKYGSDKGSTKHRYTELYQMLFLPYRKKKINFLEMGLLLGGPEHGIDKDRETGDLPSIRMWLEYFTKAKIHGLDISDFSWFENERFSFHRCDMDTRENIKSATASIPGMDIIIDDASHASHHQQNGFLELFPKLNSGGLYVIEDLRWQPKVMEKPGITLTGEMFYQYGVRGVFNHSDPAVAQSFNALRHDISGCFVFQAGYNRNKRHQVAVIHKR
jgi:hypothetical protein